LISVRSYGFSPEDKLANIAYELAFATVKHLLLQQKSPVILDTAGLHRFVFDQARRIVEDSKTQLKVILCVADRNLRNKRLRERTFQITRIRVDPTTTADYLHYFEHLPLDKLILNTDSPLETCIDRTIEFLSRMD
jgi:hypothetical protein